MTALIIILALLLILALAYLLFFIRPRAKTPENKKLLCAYAHRGLHNLSVPENSLEAFGLAASKGYGIELDVQLSLDGEVMVFHDYTLERMTGREGKLTDLTRKELQGLRLKDTDQTIPTFKEVLELVDGRVPILIELKGETFDAAPLCEKLSKILSDYNGDYCIESFNPLMVRKIQEYIPGVFCGLLYTNACREKKKRSPLYVGITMMLFNFAAKPNFIAYDKKDRRSLPVRLTTGFYRSPRFIWTLKGEDELNEATERGECGIFELE